MEIEKLVNAGLSETEAKIYLILLQKGKSRAGSISKEAQINRTTTYDILERLIKKGLVSFVMEANRKVFSAADPQLLFDLLSQQQKNLKEILPTLKEMFKEKLEDEEVAIFKGRKGLRAILQDILKHKEYLTDGSRGNFHRIMKHDFHAFQLRKKELKIKSKLLLAESSRDASYLKPESAEVRFIKDEFVSPASTFIYGNKVAIIMWSETPMAMVITSKTVAQSYCNHFNLLWRTGKR